MKIEFDKSKQIVIAKKLNTAEKSDIIEFLNNAVDVCRKHNCNKIIFDMQSAIDTMSFMDSYDLNKNLTEITNLDHTYRCAVVYANRDDKSQKEFYETVGKNWGQAFFKIFFDLKEGEDWLEHQVTRS